MKSKLIVVALIMSLPFFANAQLKGLMNKVKNKVDQRIDNKVDKQIDKTLDEIEGKETKDVASNSSTTTTTKPAETKTEEPSIKSFSKYDFVPGDSILYYDSYEKETIAELPVGWNTSGSGEVVTLDKVEGKWLRLHKQFIYLTSNTKEFGENYSVEFDVILQLKSNGWMFPDFNFGLFSTDKESNTDNGFLKDNKKYAAVFASIHPGTYKSSSIKLNSYLDNKGYFNGDPKSIGKLEESFGGLPVHVAIQVQKERLRMWINEEKLFDVPKAVPLGYVMNQLKFDVGFTNYAEEQYGVYINNIKVATGKPDTRHKLIEEGKFSTTGILFDVNSDKIKPTSYGVVKEVADVLQQNAGVKVKIIGHTDSDGSDAANLELSKKRSAAVKDMLVSEFGIDASRIETDGKGETQPLADNKTKEGKAANRRVEFVKQ